MGRLKSKVETISGALEKLAQIRGVSFEYKSPGSAGFLGTLPDDGVKDIGVIAQEIEAVLPGLVTTDKQGYKAVHYANLAGFLIQVNKEQETKMVEQEAKMEEKIEKLEATVKEMEMTMMLILGMIGVLVMALALGGVAFIIVLQKRAGAKAQNHPNQKSHMTTVQYHKL